MASFLNFGNIRAPYATSLTLWVLNTLSRSAPCGRRAASGCYRWGRNTFFY